MRFGQTQRGMTMASMMMIGVLVGLLAITLIKLYPAYYGDFAVKTSIENVAQDAKSKTLSPSALRETLMRRLEINRIDGVTKDNIEIVKDNGKIKISINYEVRTPLFGNLDGVASFSHAAEIDTE